MHKEYRVSEDEFKLISDIKEVFRKKDRKQHHAKVVEEGNGAYKVYDVNMKRVS